MTTLHDLTVAALAADLRAKKVSATEVAQHFLARSQADTSGSFLSLNAEATLAQIGEKDRARELFEGVLAKRNHLGLLSEDVAPETGELWGNFPQTYSMVGLIQCAARLSMPWDRAY